MNLPIIPPPPLVGVPYLALEHPPPHHPCPILCPLVPPMAHSHACMHDPTVPSLRPPPSLRTSCSAVTA